MGSLETKAKPQHRQETATSKETPAIDSRATNKKQKEEQKMCNERELFKTQKGEQRADVAIKPA